MKYRIFIKENKKIILLGLLLELFFGLLYLVEPLRKTLSDTSALMPKSLEIFIFTVYVLVFAFSVYFISAREAINNKEIRAKHILVFLFVFLLTLVFVFPIGSIDVFSYIYRARVHAIHHLNPYSIPYSELTHDSFYSYINNCWSGYTTLYGPLFVIVSSFIAFLGKSGVIASLLIMKGLFVILHFLNAFLLGKLFNKASIVLLYAWNPFLLFEFAVNGHNEVVLLTFVIAGLCVFKKNNNKAYNLALVFILFVCAFLVKATAIVFLPIVFLFCLLNASSFADKIRFLFFSIFGSLALSVIFFFPFWEGFQTLMRPVIHSNHVYDTLAFASPLILSGVFYLKIFNLEDYIKIFIYFSKGLFVFSYGTLCFYLLRARKNLNKSDLTKFLIIGVMLFYLLFFTWLMPWYYSILIVLFIVYYGQTSNKYSYWAIHGLTLFGIVYYFILR